MTVTIGELAAAGMPTELAELVLEAIEENAGTLTDLVLTGSLTVGTTLGVTGISTFSDDLVIATTGKAIRSNTSDAADNKTLALCGGGAFSSSRGAYVWVHGNEVASTGGTVNIDAGAASTANIINKLNDTASEFRVTSSGGTMLSVAATGKTTAYTTLTAGGTTGAQTINRPTGTVNFAAAASSLVVTNSLCTTSSYVFATIRTNDGTALIKNVVPGAGSFTITLNAAATAETSVAFWIIN